MYSYWTSHQSARHVKAWCRSAANGRSALLLVCASMLALAPTAIGKGGPHTRNSGLDQRPDNLTCLAPERPAPPATVAVRTALTMTDPSAMPTVFVQATSDLDRWYLVDRDGLIYRYQRTGKSYALAGVFGDLSSRVTRVFGTSVGHEMGLLGLVFHPQFATNGMLFAYYSATGTEGTPVEARLSRFRSTDGGLTIDLESEEVLLRVPRTSMYHWGGTMKFGPDGKLYAGFGEGNVPTQAQSLASLLGKMIRIDVDGPSGYSIPRDNPFVGTSGARGEIYAYGLRNPWKWSFDRASGDLWAGDVGASAWEEVNLIVPGGNYGWPVREGAECRIAPGCNAAGLIDPVVAYPHSPDLPSTAVIGGYVFGAPSFPALRGTYVFGESSGRLFSINYDTAGRASIAQVGDAARNINAFAQDEDGDVFIVARGRVLQLIPPSAPAPVTFPQRLSETGCMSAGDPSRPGPGLIPYDVNAPLWSDGATKDRWFAIPNGQTIRRETDGDFDLPVGSVTVKTFKLNGQLVETRLLVRHSDGDWAGYSYEWNEAQTDALLLPAGKVKVVEGQVWTFPSRNQCLACHTEAAGRTLGLEIAQLNRQFRYPSTGRTANQLATLSQIGMFQFPLLVSPDELDRLTVPSDATRPVDLRARAYLHANCAMCHRPNGPGQGPEDFRFQLPGTSIGAVNVIPTQGSFGIPDARLIYPGRPQQSIVSYRMHTLGLGRMPPLASSLVDADGVGVVDQWIRSGLGMGVADTDSDGYADNVDNCRATANPTQLDSDADGHGNMCDADFNNDSFVNALDLALLQGAFGSQEGQPAFRAAMDMNGDGRVNALDLALFQARFGRPVGDSSVSSSRQPHPGAKKQ